MANRVAETGGQQGGRDRRKSGIDTGDAVRLDRTDPPSPSPVRTCSRSFAWHAASPCRTTVCGPDRISRQDRRVDAASRIDLFWSVGRWQRVAGDGGQGS